MPGLGGAGRYSIRECFKSDTIILEAANTDTQFNIHEGLLRSISPVLSAACNREWKEGALRHYKFREDVTEQVLLCFLAWAYYGDYDCADGDDAVPSSVDFIAETIVFKDVSSLKKKATKHYKKNKKKRLPVVPSEGPIISENETPWVETPPAPQDLLEEELVEENGERQSRKTDEGHSKDTLAIERLAMADYDIPFHPLLLHAKLYTFAHLYLIQPLKLSTKQKMVDQLMTLENLYDANERSAVFDMFAYAFSKLPEGDVLLYWLARYAGWRLEELRQMPTKFDDLISAEDSNFAKLLLKYVAKSTTNPFSLSDDQIMPRYPISTAQARYNGWGPT